MSWKTKETTMSDVREVIAEMEANTQVDAMARQLLLHYAWRLREAVEASPHEIKVDQIKDHDARAGYVVLCLDEGLPVLATHRRFTRRADAVAYARTVSPSRRPIVFQLRQERPADWRPGGTAHDE